MGLNCGMKTEQKPVQMNLPFAQAFALYVADHRKKCLMNPHIRVEFRVEGEGHLVFIFHADDPVFHNRKHIHAVLHGRNIWRPDKRHRNSPATSASVWKLPSWRP